MCTTWGVGSSRKEFQIVVGCDVGARGQTWVLQKSNAYSKLLSYHIISPACLRRNVFNGLNIVLWGRYFYMILSSSSGRRNQPSRAWSELKNSLRKTKHQAPFLSWFFALWRYFSFTTVAGFFALFVCCCLFGLVSVRGNFRCKPDFVLRFREPFLAAAGGMLHPNFAQNSCPYHSQVLMAGTLLTKKTTFRDLAIATSFIYLNFQKSEF